MVEHPEIEPLPAIHEIQSNEENPDKINERKAQGQENQGKRP